MSKINGMDKIISENRGHNEWFWRWSQMIHKTQMHFREVINPCYNHAMSYFGHRYTTNCLLTPIKRISVKVIVESMLWIVQQWWK